MQTYPDDFWENLAQDVDVAHRDAMVELFNKETLMEMMGKIHDAVMQESLKQAIKTVAEERGVDEKTVIKNYFGGADADDQSGKQH
jgi:hypothetical protein